MISYTEIEKNVMIFWDIEPRDFHFFNIKSVFECYLLL